VKVTRRQFLKLAGAASLLGLAASYPVMIERYIVLVNRYRIAVPHLPAPFRGFRIVHLTDLHLGPLVPLWFLDRVIDRANRQRAEVIVCTGDYVHERNNTRQIDTIWPSLCRLSAPLGVYSVLGNHDHWANTARSLYWLQRSGQGIRHSARAIEAGGARPGSWVAETCGRTISR